MYVGCQTWDTALTAQAFCSTNLTKEFAPTIQKAYGFLIEAQVYDRQWFLTKKIDIEGKN
jgi:squalene cyclase